MKTKLWVLALFALFLNAMAHAELTEEDIAKMTPEELEQWISEGEIIPLENDSNNSSNPFRFVDIRSFEELFAEKRPFNGNDLSFDELDKAVDIYSFAAFEIKKSPTYSLSDSEMANDILFKQDQLIGLFENAINSFADTLSKPSRKSATLSFGKALASYYEKKIMGTLGIPGVAGVPVLPALLNPLEVLLPLREEYERAKKAKEGATGRDFIIEQRDHASDFRQGLALRSDAFRAVIGNVTSVGPFKEALKIDGTKLLDGLKAELAATSKEKMFYDLATMWLNETHYDGHNEPSFISVRVASDGSVTSVQMLAPSGDGIGEKLNDYYPNGTDIFRMKDVKIKVHQRLDQVGFGWQGVTVIVENGVVKTDPFYPADLSAELADHIYSNLMKNKHRFEE